MEYVYTYASNTITLESSIDKKLKININDKIASIS